MKQNHILSQYYTEEEIAEFLGKTVNSLRADACRKKGAPRTVIGKRVLYNKNSFEKYIQNQEIVYDNEKFLKKMNEYLLENIGYDFDRLKYICSYAPYPASTIFQAICDYEERQQEKKEEEEQHKNEITQRI